ncbi:exodeoxyribonuclease VII large subunit [Virgibacillus oceani]|uniref:Exodeoxyribonuclease 7 large subunit n=1 Tax=Virgibacillus oceani TaxID=1479511 RepID=A0A917H1N4_9BACI|nr:exodeoxyribonuclease VII large subunit [Virgibacillus oceani]GGG63983.1 exodeoxyribonuclease 7 large subunit [Virgibacillus oceani]
MNRNYLTVTALTKYIKRKFETDPHLKTILLKGEISNFKHHSRGHMYMTIKDDNSRIQAVMFAGNNRFLKFEPENGMNVLIKGEIGVFEPHGQYQLYIQQMDPDGIGALYLAFEQLKEKLHKQGYFNPENKKEIPKFPKRIGVITSPTGAAVRDIITTIKRRYPICYTTIIPVLVQGQNAALSIAKAIETANDYDNFDVLIVGRGGGSIEELWSFNEEIVAHAIYHSAIPVISAVGHETDTTISDFVADLRAPTPTGAAELAVPSQIELKGRLATINRSLTKVMISDFERAKQALQRIKQSYAFRYPKQLTRQKEQELDKQVERLNKLLKIHANRKKEMFINMKTRLANQHPEKQLSQARKNLIQLIKQNNYYMNKNVEQKTAQISLLLDKLFLLNPLEIMKRGFAIPYTNTKDIIKSAEQVGQDDIISLKLSDGNLDCRVLEVKEDKNDQ